MSFSSLFLSLLPVTSHASPETDARPLLCPAVKQQGVHDLGKMGEAPQVSVRLPENRGRPVQCDYARFNIVNGEKLSYGLAEPSQTGCLAVALLLSISGVESYAVTL